jgi:hypothetical protein
MNIIHFTHGAALLIVHGRITTPAKAANPATPTSTPIWALS